MGDALVGEGDARYGWMMLTAQAYRAALVFAVAGATSRFLLRHVETRWQIAAFCLVVVVYQAMIRPAAGHQFSWASTALDLISVTSAIIAMKAMIEGTLAN